MAGGSKPAHNQSAGEWPPQGQPPQHEHEQQQQPAGYGQPPGGYNAAPPAYGSQPGGANPYGAPPTGYGVPGSAPGGYGAPAGYGVQSSMPGGYGAPPTYGAPGAYGAPPPQGGYGGGYGYGQPQQAYPVSSDADYTPGTDSEAIGIFLQADVDLNGSIDAHELGRALMSTGNVAFSPRTLRLMLHLFSDNKADPSKIGPVGFVKLWKEVQQWNKKFHEFDRDNSGSIEVGELSAALMSFNFNIPPVVLQMLVAKYDVTGGNKSIGYDNFVECGFIVKGLTEKFKDQDRALSGNATFSYTSFMLMVIPFVAA